MTAASATRAAIKKLTLTDVQLCHDDVAVVNDISFEMETGQIACLLGPSGCGKSTLLRAIAGFHSVSAGEISLDGQLASTSNHLLAPDKRGIGMVFQDHALLPHMDSAANIAFAIRKGRRQAKRQRAEALLEKVGLAGLGERMPHELSGGQQQRVSLARALATDASLLLLDEPLANLDAELREKLAAEMHDLLREQGKTAIMVTHDQHEAFAFGDYIGVMNDGRLLQWDTPFGIYHQPTTAFVASFVGQGKLLPAAPLGNGRLGTAVGEIACPSQDECELYAASPCQLLLRPDDLVPDPEGELSATVLKASFQGAETLLSLRLDDGNDVLALVGSHHQPDIGSRIRLRLDMEHVILFPA